MTEPWQAWARQLQGIVVGLNVIPGVNLATLAELNALGLGVGDAGYIAWETAYWHALRWTGAVWQFAPGDVGNKFRRDFLGAPQEVGWALMDGSATDYLTVGAATLTATAVTLPDLTGSPAFHKSIAAYTGTIEPAIAATISGNTGSTAPGLSGSVSSRLIDVFGRTVDNNLDGSTVTVLDSLENDPHGHNDTFSVDSHLHAVGALANSTAARPPSIGWLPYFKR